LPGGEIKRAVAYKAIATFKKRIRQITRRTCGRSLNEVAEELRRYMPGWKVYFKLAQTPSIFQKLDGWLRHRLRALQLKQWRRGVTVYREVRKMGASEGQAWRVVINVRRWWHKSRYEMNCVMPIAYFDKLGYPDSHDLNYSNRPVRTRMAGGVGIAPCKRMKFSCLKWQP